MRNYNTIVAAALLLICGAAQASITVNLINDPVADGLFTEDSVTGYQYVWDVYTTGGAPSYLKFMSFDGTLAAWLDTHSYYGNGGVWQKWGNPAGGSNVDGWTGDDAGAPSTNDGSGGWRLGIDQYGDFGAAGSVFPWAMINTWHQPGDYAAGEAVFMPDTSVLTLDQGLAWVGTYGYGQAHNSGLMLTIRVVHPGEPGLMSWETNSGSGTTIGPTGEEIPEPVTLGMLALGGLAMLRGRKR